MWLYDGGKARTSEVRRDCLDWEEEERVNRRKRFVYGMRFRGSTDRQGMKDGICNERRA